MHRIKIASLFAGTVGRWHLGLHRAAAFGVTIRGRIMIAFLVTSILGMTLNMMIMFGLGIVNSVWVHRRGDLR